MMQWKKSDYDFEVKDYIKAIEPATAQASPAHLFDQVIHSLATALSRVGVPSITLLVMVAIIVATVLFGLSAEDAVALGKWCPGC